MVWVSPRAWAVGETVTAAKMNEISSSLHAAGDSWVTYSPTLTASVTDPTMGASVLTGRYRVVGKTADIRINLTIGSGFAPGSGTYRFSYPPGVIPLTTIASDALGVGTVRDTSAGSTYCMMPVYLTSTMFIVARADNNPGVASASPIVWATGDTVNVSIRALELA